jgi:hypothetical protein
MNELASTRETRLARDVAIKLLPATFTAAAVRVGRLERGAELLSAHSDRNTATRHTPREFPHSRRTFRLSGTRRIGVSR